MQSVLQRVAERVCREGCREAHRGMHPLPSTHYPALAYQLGTKTDALTLTLHWHCAPTLFSTSFFSTSFVSRPPSLLPTLMEVTVDAKPVFGDSNSHLLVVFYIACHQVLMPKHAAGERQSATMSETAKISTQSAKISTQSAKISTQSAHAHARE